MNEELLKIVTEKTGLSKEKAEKTIEILLNYLKDKLPAPVASEVEGIIIGKSDIRGGVKGLDL